MQAEPEDEYRSLDTLDTSELERSALSLREAEDVSGPAEVWREGPFTDISRRLARTRRLASGSVGPGSGPWFLREGLHLGPSLRLIAFARPLPPRAVVRIDPADALRLFPRHPRA